MLPLLTKAPTPPKNAYREHVAPLYHGGSMHCLVLVAVALAAAAVVRGYYEWDLITSW